MSEKEQLREDIIIEGSTALWDIKLEGEIQGTYIGAFRFRCFLTPVQQISANREYRELLGSNPLLAADHETKLAWALTQLKHRVINAPPFWNSSLSGLPGGDIPDDNVIMAVIEAAIDAEVKYKAHLKKRKEEAVDKAKKAAEKILSQQKEETQHEDKT